MGTFLHIIDRARAQPEPVRRQILWFVVSVAVIAIFLFWLFTLRFTLLAPPDVSQSPDGPKQESPLLSDGVRSRLPSIRGLLSDMMKR